MRIFIVLILLCFAVPGICEESTSRTWTYSTGLKIVSVKKLNEYPGKSTWKMEHKGNDYVVTINGYFFTNGDFEEPTLSLTREGKTTLTVKSKEQKGFKNSAEYPVQVTIKIDGKRLHKAQTVYFYNGDYGEVAGHQVIK